MNCVQCHQKMEDYGHAGDVQIFDSKGFLSGIDRIKIFRCQEPECPNFNLLQGDLPSNNKL